MWKLGQWLNAKELTTEHTRETLAAEASELIDGAPVTVNNIDGLLNMVGKSLVSSKTMDADQKVKILARELRTLLINMGMQVPSDLLNL
jgi:hypothetical protein